LNIQNNISQEIDTTPPVVSITNPKNGAAFRTRSLITVTAIASDNVGVVDVRFYLNGSQICTDKSATYQCQMRLPKKRQTSTIKVIARDAAGNSSQSSISVTGR
jgi:hypothetical protein